MDGDEVLTRLAGAVLFLLAAAVALMYASLGASIESDSSWSDRGVRAWLVFSGANVVAAAIATVRRSTAAARIAGFLLVAPAAVLLDTTGHGDTVTAIAAALVLLGGALAGGVFRRG